MKGCKFRSILGTLACQTHRDTGHPFIKIISEDPWPSYLLPSIYQWSVTKSFYDLGLSRLGFEFPSFRLLSERFNPLRHHRGFLRICSLFFSIWPTVNKIYENSFKQSLIIFSLSLVFFRKKSHCLLVELYSRCWKSRNNDKKNSFIMITLRK